MDGGPQRSPGDVQCRVKENPSKKKRQETRAGFVSSVPLGELCGGNRKASDPCVNYPQFTQLESVSLRRAAQGFTCLERRGAERSLQVPLGPGDRELFWVLSLPLQAV